MAAAQEGGTSWLRSTQEEALAKFGRGGESSGKLPEDSKKEYTRAMRQQLDITKEQLGELKQHMEQSVLELRQAIRDWHDAHQGLVLQLA